MCVCIEYVENGILFTGQYLDWDADETTILAAAAAVAPQVPCHPAAIEGILRFELRQRQQAS